MRLSNEDPSTLARTGWQWDNQATLSPLETRAAQEHDALVNDVDVSWQAGEGGLYCAPDDPGYDQSALYAEYARRALQHERMHHQPVGQAWTTMTPGTAHQQAIGQTTGGLTTQKLDQLGLTSPPEPSMARYAVIDASTAPVAWYTRQQMRAMGISYGDNGTTDTRAYAAQHVVQNSQRRQERPSLEHPERTNPCFVCYTDSADPAVARRHNQSAR